MPLVRLQIRNELGLGDPALYRSAPDDDPKSVLDGVAVAGLVGILRQLGDLAKFAADVFRDTLEQVEATTSRCNKIRSQVRSIESALTPIEKAVKVQTSHLHFAYTSGSSWHSKVRTKHKHLNHSGLPKFMMDTYEQCRGPPHLSLLDRFDSAGSGACLKRYSDPSYFKKVHMGSALSKVEKDKKRKKSRHGKKRRLQPKLGVDSEAVSIVGHHVGARSQFTSFDCDMATPRSTMALESDPSSYLLAFGSGKHILYSNNPLKSVKDEQHQLPTSSRKTNCVENNSSALEDLIQINEHYDLQKNLLLGEANLRPSSVSWDEGVETLASNVQRSEENFGNGPVPLEYMPTQCDLSKLNVITANLGMFEQDDIVFDVVNMPESFSHADCLDEIITKEEYFIEGIKPLNSPTEMDTQCQANQKVVMQSTINFERVDIAYEDTLQASNMFSDSSQKDSCVQSYSCSEKEPCPDLGQVEPIEKVHVHASQIFPAVLDTIRLRHMCEENGDQIKQEIELNSDVQAEEVGIADGLTVQMGDQLRDSVSEESCNLHSSSFDEGSSPAPYQIQPVEKIHLEGTQMSPLVLDMVSTRDFSEDEIECQTKQEVGLASTLKAEEVENADKCTVQMSNQFKEFPSEVSSIQCNISLVDRETSPVSCLIHPMEKTNVEVKETTPHGIGTFSLRDFGEGEIEYQTKHEIELDGDVKDEVGTADGLTPQMGDWFTDSPSEGSCIFPDNPLDNEFSLDSFHIQPVELVHAEVTQMPSLGINILGTRNSGEEEIECQTKREVELLRNVIAKEVDNGDALTVGMGDQFRESLCMGSSIQTDSFVGNDSSPASCQIPPLEKIQVEANQTSSLALNTSSLTDSGKGGTECQAAQEVELPSNIIAEGVEIADKVVAQMNNMFTDFLNEELSILHGSSLDKRSSPASCQIQPLERTHSEVSQTPPPGLAMDTTRDFGEVEIEFHTKQEVKLQDDVRPEEVENADVMVEMVDQLTDALNEEFPILYDSSIDKELSPASCLIQPSENIHGEVCHLSTLGLHMGSSKAFCEKEIECQTKREVETADSVMAYMGDMRAESLEGTSILSGSSLDNESSPASHLSQPADKIHVEYSQGSPLGLDALGSKDFGEEETEYQTKREVEMQTDIKEEIFESVDKCPIQMGHLCADSIYGDFSVLSHSSLDKEYAPASSPIEKIHLDIVQASPLGLCRVSSRDSGEGDGEFQIKQEVEFKSDIKAERFVTVDCLDVHMGDLFTSSLNSESSISSYSCLGDGSSPAPCVIPPVENTHPEVILTSFGLGKVGLRACSGNEKEMVCPTKPEVELQSYIKVGKVETVGDQTDFLNINSTDLSYCFLDKEASSALCPVSQEDAKTMQTSFQDLDTVSSRNSSNCSNCLDSSRSGDFSLRGSSKRSDCLGSSTGGDFSSGDSNECDILGSSTTEDFKSASWPPSWSVPADLQMLRIAGNLCHTENDSKASGFPEGTIWTNGGLLGLEPSKPPDLSGPDDANNKNHKKPDTAVSEEQAIKLEELNPYVVFGTCTPSVPRQTSLEQPSSFSGFSNMFLKNASWGKATVTDNNYCESSVASVNALQEPLRDMPDKVTSECTFPALHDVAVEEKFGLPSPALEHMKISFHSVSGSEASKMKLEFFGESPVNSQEGGRFPSFRLLLDHSGTRHAIDSDSEDTFCRLSQYMSDDALSECSDLSSEQWDYKECNGSKDHEIYEVLRSAPSSSLEIDVKDLVEGP